jgi:DmsE family decaheme c-type cytochrome
MARIKANSIGWGKGEPLMRISPAPKTQLLTAFALSLLVLAAVPAAADKSKPGSQEKKYTRPTDPSLYVGEETCKTCHEDMPSKGFYKSYEDSPHFATTLDTKKGPEWHGCEACHGPGKAHVEGGGDKSKIFTFKGASASEISARCLDCHEYGEEHSNFARSAHLQNGVSCTDCHDPHHAKESQFLMKEKTPLLCYGCHQEVKQQFNRTFHHRVNEGLVQCNDCHNPHGGFLTRQVRATSSQDTVCFKCHSDKAGPFVFEHKAVKVEGCASCHTPHGSSNARLLKRAQVNLLCLECHAFSADPTGPNAPPIPTFHNQAQKYQACTLCHTAIHGSNTDQFLFKP